MYKYVYEFIKNYLFNYGPLSSYQTEIMGISTTINVWLSHTLSIVVMILIFVVLVMFTKWLFRLASGLFLLK